MIYQDQSREELITGIKEIKRKEAALQELCITTTAAHKKALEEIEASENRYRRLFETAKDGILILDAETGMIKDVNPYLIEILGYTKDQFIEKRIWDIGCFKDIAANKEKFMELRRKNYVRYDNLPLQTSNGKKINVEFVSNVYVESHQVVIQCNIRDISERMRTEQVLIVANNELAYQIEENRKRALELIKSKEKAEESDRLKSAFLANMSHEIRTPMNGILGFSNLLKEPGLKGELQQEYIRIIEKSGNRMLNIINDIIDISKIESGLMEINLKESNINEKVEYIYNFFKPEAERKGMNLFVKKSDHLHPVIIITDQEKLYAILTNLVKNAIKYTRQGFIEIGFGIKGNNLEFFVKDTGIGIPPNRQKAVFERFIQADISDKQAYQGAGLGLSIAKAYVELLGGKIWMDSVESMGTTFYFTLPFVAATTLETDLKQNEVVAESVNQGKSLKILIVEDDETSERLMEIGVGNLARHIFKARTGAEAVRICHEHPDLDLVMMDLQMPVMDGFDATRQIRAFNRDVIIIAQTAFAFASDRKKAIEAGCNDYIAKPVLKEELHSVIEKYFSN